MKAKKEKNVELTTQQKNIIRDKLQILFDFRICRKGTIEANIIRASMVKIAIDCNGNAVLTDVRIQNHIYSLIHDKVSLKEFLRRC